MKVDSASVEPGYLGGVEGMRKDDVHDDLVSFPWWWNGWELHV